MSNPTDHYRTNIESSSNHTLNDPRMDGSKFRRRSSRFSLFTDDEDPIHEHRKSINSIAEESASNHGKSPERRASNGATEEDQDEGVAAEAPRLEDTIFHVFKNDDGLVHMGHFFKVINDVGIRLTDARLAQMMTSLKRLNDLHKQKKYSSSIESMMLDQNQFTSAIADNIVVLEKILRNQLIIPNWETFCHKIEELYYKCESDRDGEVADYIPQLARMDPDKWAVSVCTVDGQRFDLGDSTDNFCLQSTSKCLNYALALMELGQDYVHRYVGFEPSGRMFNDLSLDFDRKPHNPMINSGAIITTSLLKGKAGLADKYDHITNFYRRMAGGEFIGFNNAVFISERETADRNYALAFYMRENNCFPDGGELHSVMDLYFQLCSVEVTCDSASVLAASLANGGICPINDDPVITPSCVRDVLSLMYSCGMYDYSGQFAFKIGLPTKSGVSGAVLLVVPNVCGIALWSPKLDRWGNSVRSVLFCEEFVKTFNFHNYDNFRHMEKQKLDPRKSQLETKGQQVINILFSAANGDVSALRRHLLHGADLSASDYDGRTPMHIAAAEGHQECVEFLLVKGNAPSNPVDRWGHTPADEARRAGHDHIAEALDYAGSSKEQNIAQKNSVLRSSLRRGNNRSKSPSIQTATVAPQVATHKVQSQNNAADAKKEVTFQSSPRTSKKGAPIAGRVLSISIDNDKE